MAEKRKAGIGPKSVIEKRTKMTHLPINSHTINNILPALSNEDFDTYMTQTGPELWKEATDNVSLEDAKKLLLLITRRRPSLDIQIAVYFTLCGLDEKPHRHLYDLFFGDLFRQTRLMTEPQNVYMFCLNKMGYTSYIFPILPNLKHNQHYFCLNKNFVKIPVTEKEPRIEPTTELTPKAIYFKKLTSAMTCEKLERWPEAFAYSLSALDAYQEEFSYLHDVFCYIAMSANKMAVPLQWCCKVLTEARLVSTSLEQTWRRILVFQTVLIDNGLFELENKLFLESKKLFVTSTTFFQVLHENHINAKMEEVENNLAFQFVRQKFHFGCEDFCEKDACVQQSFGRTQTLLNTMDTCVQSLSTKGLKEYFRGYFYLYNSMMVVNRKKLDNKTQCHINLALQFFLLAKEQMKKTDGHYNDLELIILFLKKGPLSGDSIIKQFSENAFVRHTHGASKFFFRAMLITMYWDNQFQPLPILMLTTNARQMEVKVTNGYGYRGPLLASCLKILDDLFYHVKGRDITDYPNLFVTPERETTIADANQYWKNEKDDVGFHPVDKVMPKKKKTLDQNIPSAETIINKNKLAEQVYAFGYQIVEARTTATNL